MSGPRRAGGVVILGGGAAGCATAIALRRAGVEEVRVVEAGRYDRQRVGETVPPDTRVLLDRLGLWNAFLEQGHDPCHGSCSSWGSDEPGYNDFLFNPFGDGWHLDRNRFDRFLADQAESRGARLLTATRCEGCERIEGGGFRLRLRPTGEPPETVTARFVVDATGTRAAVARRLGARRMMADRLLCVYGFFEPGAGSDFPGLTFLEAVEYGWWYAARLPGGRLTAAVASDPDLLREKGLGGPAGWLARLAATRLLAPRLAGWRFLAESLIVAPAPCFRLEPPAAEGWLAVGDAASAFDPIASQGIHKALADGLEAGSAIAAALAGDDEPLASYGVAVRSRFDAYLGVRDDYYAAEGRWPHSRFWSRRRGGRDPTPAEGSKPRAASGSPG